MKRNDFRRKLRQASTWTIPSETPYTESWNYQLYAIRLDDSVIDDAKYRAKNPKYVKGMPNYYIGATSLTPENRFLQHRGGNENASRIAHTFGRELCTGVVPERKPTRRTWVFKHERKFAEELRARGCGVWQA